MQESDDPQIHGNPPENIDEIQENNQDDVSADPVAGDSDGDSDSGTDTEVDIKDESQ